MQTLKDLIETVYEKDQLLTCGTSTEAFQLSPLSASQSQNNISSVILSMTQPYKL